MVEVRWTGAAGLDLTHEGQTILVDPYLSRPGKLQLLLRRVLPRVELIKQYLESLPGELSAIILGHTHFDHALDIPEMVKGFDGPLVGSKSLDTLLSIHGMQSRVAICEGGERVELPGGALVTMLRSQHGLVLFGRVPYPGEIDPTARPPLKASQYRVGTVFAPKLEFGGITFMHVGSANLVESELQGHSCDVLFMGVPGWKKVPEYISRLLEIAKPKTVIPFHFDDFMTPLSPELQAPNLPLVDMRGFTERLHQASSDVEIRIPRIFESIEL
jgi:L-ascorbate metabolism protein UlaG (beta-lactamase superfamily)